MTLITKWFKFDLSLEKPVINDLIKKFEIVLKIANLRSEKKLIVFLQFKKCPRLSQLSLNDFYRIKTVDCELKSYCGSKL